MSAPIPGPDTPQGPSSMQDGNAAGAAQSQQTDQVRSLATALASVDSASAHVLKGTVTAVDSIVFSNVPHTVTVTMSGDTTSIAGVRFLNSYSPLVGDTVLMVKQGSDLFVLGQMSVALPSAAGWTQPTLGTGFTHDGNDPIQYRVVYDNGSPKVQLRGGATQSGSNTTIFTMPAEFRPLTNKTPILIARDTAGGSNVAQLVVNSSGTMVLTGPTVGVKASSGSQTGVGGGSAVTGNPSGSTTSSSGSQGESGTTTSGSTTNMINDGSGNNFASHVHFGNSHTHTLVHTHVGGAHQHPLDAVTHPTSVSLNGVEYFL